MKKNEVANCCPLCGKEIEIGTESTIIVWGIGETWRDVQVCEDCERKFEMIYADEEGGEQK